jgi:hypothetical protein
MPLDGKGTKRWWLVEGDAVAGAVSSVVEQLRKNDRARIKLDRWRLLYLYGHGDAAAEPTGADEVYYSTYNVIREAVDTMHARISKGRPNVQIVPSGADWQLTDRAEKLSTWLDGEFERVDMHELTSDALHDACVYGTGCIKSIVDAAGRPSAQLIYRGHLSVDPKEERMRCVKTLYQTAYVDRTALAEQYPHAREAIADLDEATIDPEDEAHDVTEGADDIVCVHEAWRLGSGDKPGRWVVVAGDVVLLDEEWAPEKWFPFSFIKYSRNPRGFWGIGLPERLCGGQADLNALCTKITESYRHWVPWMFVWEENLVSADQFTNAVGTIHTIAGTKPPFILQSQAIGQDFNNRESWRAQQMLNSEGISALAARSEKPAGLNSGKALIVHQDVESERHIVFARAFEQLHVDVAKQHLCRAEEIASGEGDHKDKLRAMGGQETLDVVHYDEARMDADQYRARAQPVSSFSRSLAGKLQELDVLMDRQLITDPDEAREILDMADLKRNTQLRLSPRRVAQKIIDHAAQGKAIDDLLIEEVDIPFAVDQCRRRICLAKMEGRPESALAELRRAETFFAQKKADLDAAQMPPSVPTNPAGPPPGMPPDGGLPMPTGAPMAA